MRPETTHLCDLLEQAKSQFSGAEYERSDLKCSLKVGTSRLTVSEVGNTHPAVVTANVGTTITLQEVDEPELLPPPTSGRYQADSAAAIANWRDLVAGDLISSDELIEAAIETLKEYVENAS